MSTMALPRISSVWSTAKWLKSVPALALKSPQTIIDVKFPIVRRIDDTHSTSSYNIYVYEAGAYADEVGGIYTLTIHMRHYPYSAIQPTQNSVHLLEDIVHPSDKIVAIPPPVPNFSLWLLTVN